MFRDGLEKASLDQNPAIAPSLRKSQSGIDFLGFIVSQGSLPPQREKISIGLQLAEKFRDQSEFNCAECLRTGTFYTKNTCPRLANDFVWRFRSKMDEYCHIAFDRLCQPPETQAP
jgi:hypothetical protein